jgi:DUF1009 family protein
MRFDVPVIGAGTHEAMAESGSTALAIDAGRTLMIDKAAFLDRAEAAGIAVWGLEAPETEGDGA